MEFIVLLDHLGTFAFALSGIRLASEKKFDWFGAYVLGLVTAIGGGTTRDLLLGVLPFWMENASYLIVTAIALLAFVFWGRLIVRMGHTLLLFDSIGLGLFVVIGIDKTLATGLPYWVAIVMGMISGSVGGVIRDILSNETPLIFRKDIYAMACILGGLIYFLLHSLGLSLVLTQTFAALSIILIRIVSVKLRVQVPVLKID